MAEKDKDNDELTPVGPGAADGAQDDEDSRDEPAAGEDYTPAGDEDEDSEERVGHAEGEEPPGEPDDRLSLSQRRRRKQREKYQRDQRELAFLRTRNEQLEREQSRRFSEIENRQSQNDLMAIDSRIAQAESNVHEAETLLTQALEQKDAAAVTEALRVRDELRDGLRNLQGVKAQTVNAARQRQTEQRQPPAADPLVVQRANEWMHEHSWYDPRGSNEDSQIALVIEQQLFREGRLDPRSDEYYAELDRRLARRLPERYRDMRTNDDEPREEDARERRPNGNGNGARRASGGPTFRTGGRERTLRKGEVFVDADRRAAMEEAGVWDDPVLRQKYLESYQKYDREHGRRRH